KWAVWTEIPFQTTSRGGPTFNRNDFHARRPNSLRVPFELDLLRCLLLPPIYSIEFASEKIADGSSNFSSVRFQGKVPGFEEMQLGARVVALERFGARRQEERIVLSPYRKQGRLLRAEIFLKLGIESDVAGVVQKQVELNLVVPRPG